MGIKRISFLFLIIFFLFTPFFARAGFKITEVMYDLSGTDTDREWVEIENSGGSEVLKDLRFVDKAGRHLVKSSSSDSNFPANSCVVLVKDILAFKNDYPSFNGVIFESSLSLVNTTDKVSFIRFVDGSENVFDTVIYSNEIGAKGDGNSLHREGESLKPGIPNPGVCGLVPITPPVNPPPSSDSEPKTGNASSTENYFNNNFPTSPQIFLRLNIPVTASVGVPVDLKAELTGLDKKPLTNARIIWSFGDGTTKEGYSVSHTWQFPGEYMVVAEASSGIYNASSRQKIFLSKADVAISRFNKGNDGFIELKNYASNDLDLSFFILKTNDKQFILPKNTIIPASSSIVIPNTTTSIYDGEPMYLNYPNGTQGFVFYESKNKVITKIADGQKNLNEEQNIKKIDDKKIITSEPKNLNVTKTEEEKEKGEQDELTKINLSANVRNSSANFYFPFVLFILAVFCVIMVLIYSKIIDSPASLREVDEYKIEEINDD